MKTLATMALVGIVVVALIAQPWQKKQLVLLVQLPQSAYTVELWERPYWYLLGDEYETWFVIRSSSQEEWHLIDSQYITFNMAYVLISSDNRYIRVETTGKSSKSHMVAEYDLANKSFRAASDSSVINRTGWSVLKEKHIR